MSYQRTFLMGGHLLVDSMSYWRQVLREACLRGGHILQEDFFLDNINITRMICLTGSYILQENMH